MIENKIKELLKKKINISFISIKDLRSRHTNHQTYSGGAHLKLLIVSNDFIDVSLINRHRMIYNLIGPMIRNEIHAISIKAKTIDEYK
tara:strand:- start:653 stop:916 length:264 start_codon:yes stop_codon:yes gene_type:complete